MDANPMTDARNDATCPQCGLAVGDHTIRGYSDCLEAAGMEYALPYAEIPGGPLQIDGVEGQIAGEIVVQSGFFETPIGKVPILRFVFVGAGSEPMSRVRMEPITLVMDAKGLRATVELVSERRPGLDCGGRIVSESKADYVRRQAQDRRHTCHWPNCDQQVPPAMWGCRPHWYRLPRGLRSKVWAAYVPGQERTLTPSSDYLAVAREVQTWIEEHGG